MKYIVITGGVISGLGKGECISKLGSIICECKVNPTIIKIDPYLNQDAGTMAPGEHGETFVLNDGGEVDLDLGNYERAMGISLTRDHNITAGKAYFNVLKKEREGVYLGKTVQMIPHVSDEILDWIEKVARIPVNHNSSKPCIPDVCLIEVGGTVGDLDSILFLETLRRLRLKVGNENYFHIHLTNVLLTGENKEPKTKPTQHSLQELRRFALEPNLLFCRSVLPLKNETIDKLSIHCSLPKDSILSLHDVPVLFQITQLLLDQNVCAKIFHSLKITQYPVTKLAKLNAYCAHFQISSKMNYTLVGVVGKYTNSTDSYLSLLEAIKHASFAVGKYPKIIMIESEHLEESWKEKSRTSYVRAWSLLKTCNSIIVPGGFGTRGIEGKICAIKYAREFKIPFLGICLGFQLACIELARSKANIPDASSEEFETEENKNSKKQFIVVYMPEISHNAMGGNMRLGAKTTTISQGTLAAKIYKNVLQISERHRHRYEFNIQFKKLLEYKAGAIFSGQDEEKERMECIELPQSSHPFFFACQFHPEYQSQPLKPSPPFYALLDAADYHMECLACSC